jgi:hypothetical protein
MSGLRVVSKIDNPTPDRPMGPFSFFPFFQIFYFIYFYIIFLRFLFFLYSAICQPQRLTRGKPLIFGRKM